MLSESFFIFLTILFIIYLQDFLRRERWLSLILIALIAALAVMQRYMGSVLVATGFISIVLLPNKLTIYRRIRMSFCFIVISTTPVIIWLIRDFILTQTYFRPNFPSNYSLSQNAYFIIDLLTVWFIPRSVPFLMRAIILSSFTFIAVAIVFISLKSGIRDRKKLAATIPLGIFIIFYISVLLISATTFAFERIDHRYLSPVYIFIIFFILLALDDILALSNLFRAYKILIKFLVLVIFSLWLLYPFAYAVKMISHWMLIGAGEFNTITWRNSQVAYWVKANPLPPVVYSNFPDALYFFTGLKAENSPKKFQFNSFKSKGDDLLQFKESLRLKEAYLVWFYNSGRDYLYNINELSSVIGLREIANLSDGAIYLLKSAD